MPYRKRTTFAQVFTEPGTAVETSTDLQCQVYVFEDYATPTAAPPTNHHRIGDLVRKWEEDVARRTAIEQAREWLTSTVYSGDENTVRTLRLRKGWSQVRLAEELGTSQSHLSRIEAGTENITIDTCRRLSKALDIDINTLDQALARQEALMQAKQK